MRKSPSWIPRKSNKNKWNWKKYLDYLVKPVAQVIRFAITRSKWNWRKPRSLFFKMNNVEGWITKKNYKKKIMSTHVNFSSSWPKHKTGKVSSRKTMNLNPQKIKYWRMELKKQSIILLLPNCLPYFWRIFEKNQK
jgi:hypothetical protein